MQTSTLTAVAAVLATAGMAAAGPLFSTVNTPPGAEHSHAQILQSIYPTGSWSNVAATHDYSNGAASAVRVADAGLGAFLSLAAGDAPTSVEDGVWSGGPVTVVARAKFAGDSSVFGWMDDSQESPAFQAIFPTGSFNTPVTLSPDGSFRWALRDLSTGLTFTSRKSDNAGVGARSGEVFDQMVTYRVTGSNTPGVIEEYVLFWEDRVAGQSADYDYNDAAIVVSVIPAPGAGALALAGLGLVARRRRVG